MSPQPDHAPDPFSGYKKRATSWLHQTCGATWASRIIAFCQFWELVVTGFINNRCPVRATALAYTTLLALIPLIAIIVSVSTSILKSQGREPIDRAIAKLVEQITPKLEDSNEGATSNSPTSSAPTPSSSASTNTLVAPEDDSTTQTNRVMFSNEGKKAAADALKSVDRQLVVDVIKDSLNNVQSGSLGATGMIGLIMVAILLFSTIEATFNDIWGVRHGRSWVVRIVQYWATVTLGPLIPFAVLSLNIGASLESVDAIMGDVGLGFASQFFLEKVVPIMILSLGFSFFYQLMPNTKVQWTAAMVGGLAAGILWQLNNMLNVVFVSKVVTFSKIYGPMAMIPVFLVGLYFSWLILLFGAQVAYAYQNRVAYLQEKEAQRINFLGREYLALRVMTLLGQRFDDPEGKAPGVIESAKLLRISTRLVDEILQSMTAGGLVIETNGDETGYTLTRPLEKISLNDILMALRTARGHVTDTADDAVKPVVDAAFKNVLNAEQVVSQAASLRQLVDQANTACQAAPQPV